MIWLLVIACLLLLAYPLDPITLDAVHVPGNQKTVAALTWKLLGRTLVRLEEQFVLIDRQAAYAYQDGGLKLATRGDTYVPAVRMDTGRLQYVLNHRYLMEWLRSPARVVWYEPGPTLVDSLNNLLKVIKMAN